MEITEAHSNKILFEIERDSWNKMRLQMMTISFSSQCKTLHMEGKVNVDFGTMASLHIGLYDVKKWV